MIDWNQNWWFDEEEGIRIFSVNSEQWELMYWEWEYLFDEMDIQSNWIDDEELLMEWLTSEC
jgi:hypothetical protein